ncbi:hypothetical protein RI129_002680 [Pyrocoelia pectoralis]|uniref:Replication protein A C-terminal domain-containing protein n=1 Tax=Pyrocoelia pectoralis TaxID=417401 RepID=A0AAN7VNI8_9COLE
MWNDSAFGDSTSKATGFFNAGNDGDNAQPKTKGQARRLQSVVPVCVRQVRDHPEEEFKLFGTPTQILTLVAMLKNCDVQSTKATYELEDHTGRIKAILWLENDNNSAPNLPLVKEGCYLRIYGSLRVQEGEKILMVLKMYPVDDINEITNHLLCVIQTRLEAEAASKGPGPLANIKKNNPGAELANSMSFMGDMDLGNSARPHFTPLQEKLYNILKADTSAQGLHRTVVCQSFPPNLHREVNTALENLINEGHAYSTIDNDHFKITDSM